MNAAVPALGIIIDLALGILMWAAMLRFLLSMVMKEDSRAAPMRILNATVMPATRLTAAGALGDRAHRPALSCLSRLHPSLLCRR